MSNYAKVHVNKKARQCSVVIPSKYWDLIPHSGYFKVERQGDSIVYTPCANPPDKVSKPLPHVEKRVKTRLNNRENNHVSSLTHGDVLGENTVTHGDVLGENTVTHGDVLGDSPMSSPRMHRDENIETVPNISLPGTTVRKNVIDFNELTSEDKKEFERLLGK